MVVTEPSLHPKTPKTNRVSGKLLARPSGIYGEFATPVAGLHPLEIGEERDGYIYVPERAAQVDVSGVTPAPLLVLLHGGNGEALGMLPPFRDLADENGVILLLPDSRKRTWDVIRGGIGEDLEFIDRALNKVFSEYAIRRNKIAVGGFSDGASCALSIGLPNGGLFTHVLAFSPGFVAPFAIEGTPQVFVSHGCDDRVLVIERCSRRIVPHLRRMGFQLEYVEFTGGHTIPESVARESMAWFNSPSAYGRGG